MTNSRARRAARIFVNVNVIKFEFNFEGILKKYVCAIRQTINVNDAQQIQTYTAELFIKLAYCKSAEHLLLRQSCRAR